MDYTPRYAQPFTLQQAVALDVPIITEEIARLENSLTHLRQTQSMLEEYNSTTTTSDPELSQAYDENQTVIGSQEERISMLKMALTHKGIVSSTAHYDTPPPSESHAQEEEPLAAAATRQAQGAENGTNVGALLEEEDEGIHL